MVNEDNLVSRFIEYVKIDSPTKKELSFSEVLMEDLRKIGFQVSMDNSGEKVGSNSGNIIAKLKGNTNKNSIMFNAHMDTVSPGEGINPIIKNRVIYSDGTTILGADDKAGIAAIVEGIKTTVEKGLEYGDIEVVFTIYEEGGLYGAKNIDYSKLNSKDIFVLDSGGSPGEIIVSGPAQNKINFKFIGKTAHAGVAPEDGISAISIAARAINNMKLLRIDEETTANIGKIKGGEATNIVADVVEVESEARSLNNTKLENQTNHMIKCAKDAASEIGGEVEFEIDNVYDAFTISEESNVVSIAKNACKNLDLHVRLKSSGGGSDTNIWNKNGFNAINLGVGMKKSHTLEEYISIKDLVDSTKLVMEIIKLYNKN